MDRAPPRGAPRDAVGQRWLAVFAFQAALSAAASVVHLAASPRHRHPSLGIPPALLLALHPFLSFAATVLLALAFLISASPHPRAPPVPLRALAAFLIAAAGALGLAAAASLVPEDAGWAAVAGLGFRGAVLGAVFAAHYFGRGRWLLQFPVVQVRIGEKLGFLDVLFDSSPIAG
jgi:nucleoporin NDC1